MESATAAPPAAPQVKKYLVRNNTAGYVGVVKIDGKGDEHGENVDPHGTIWLTEAEIVATARAPRRAEDNPFEEQTLLGFDTEQQRTVEFRVRPLTLEKDTRYLPQHDRYVPTEVLSQGEGAPAVNQSPATEPPQAPAPPTTGSTADQTPPPAPPVASPAAPALRPPQSPAGAPPEQADEGESWVQAPEAPGQVIKGSLSGNDVDTSAPEQAPDPTNAPGPDERFVPSVTGAQATVMPPGASAAPDEEHAEAVDPQIGEETGAAKPPAQDPPEGEYAQREEVGTPETGGGQA